MERTSAIQLVTAIAERLACFSLRLAAIVMTWAGLAGVAAVTSALALGRVEPRRVEPFVSSFVRAALPFNAIFLVAGVGAWYLARTRRQILPNERVEVRAQNPAPGGWLLGLGAALVLLPLVMAERLEPLLLVWTDSLEWLRASGLGEQVQRSPDYSGLVLIPLVAALGVPFLEACAALSFAGGSLLLLMLLVGRSGRFPRAFLVCLVLQAGLVVASRYGTELTAGAATVIEREAIREAQANTPEGRRVIEEIRRYDRVVRSSADTLTLTLLGYLVWAPALFFSGRVRITFAPSPAAQDLTRTRSFSRTLSRITINGRTYATIDEMPPDVRGAYEQALRLGLKADAQDQDGVKRAGFTLRLGRQPPSGHEPTGISSELDVEARQAHHKEIARRLSTAGPGAFAEQNAVAIAILIGIVVLVFVLVMLAKVLRL